MKIVKEEKLQNKREPFAGTVILGVFFGAWLLPEFFQPDSFQFSMGGMSFFPWFILTEIGWSILMTWVYNNTGKSTLIAGYLFHVAFNTWPLVLLTNAIPGESLLAFDTTLFIVASVVVALAGVVVLVTTKGKLGWVEETKFLKSRIKKENIMKKLQNLIIIVLSMFLLSACAVDSIAGMPNIEGVTWVLTKYNDVRPIDGALPTMELEGDQVSGTTGCNRYWGSYQITGDAISFEDFYRTEIGCTEPERVMDQERIYLDLLRSADRFELSETEDVLTIFAGEHQILIFETKNEVSLSAPTQEQPTITPTDIVVEPTLTPTFESPVGFKEYRDSVIGVSIYIPESWVVTGVIEGDYAIFQSYPEDKYVGGEGRDPEDTKCDLNIQPAGTSVGELIQQWESDELTTIVSDEEVGLQSGLIGQRFVIESMGRSVAFATEINKRAIVLSCFGNPEPFEKIVNTLSGFERTASSIHDANDGFKEYRDSVIGVSIHIPESWVVTGVIEGDYAIFQSYPEDKYVGGEGRDPEDTKCDLNIQPAGTSVGELIQQWESDELTTIVSDEEVSLQSGLIGQRFVIESMGRSVAFVTEINKRAIVLSCFGNPEPFEKIVNTLSEFEVALHDPEGDFKQYRDSETGVTLDVPGSWVITEVYPGVKATLQSLETTCELFIRSDFSAEEIITQTKSNENITIISEDQIVLNSGQSATRIEMNIEMDNIGQSMKVITEINENVIVLSCVGDYTPVYEIANTIKTTQ